MQLKLRMLILESKSMVKNIMIIIDKSSKIHKSIDVLVQ